MTPHARKKVIIFITKSNWGGAQKYVFDLATQLPKTSFEVLVALGGKDLLYTKLIEAGIPIIELNSLQRDVHFAKDIYAFFNILRIIRKERPDIIHVNSTKISGLGAVAGRMLGVKNIIFTVHGWAFNENRSFVSKNAIKALYLVMLWLSHSIIAVSKNITQQVKGWPFVKKNMHVVRNGMASPEFISKEEARISLEKTLDTTFSDTKILCGGIGELHPIKGQIYGIQAIEKFIRERPTVDIAYIIIGAGELENELRKEIIDRNLSGKVFLTGYLKDAANYLKAFDYYLFPSLSEGLAYAAIEAGFAKLPVIATNVGGLPEVITHEKEGLLVQSQNPEAILTALYTYIDNPEVAKKYAAALYKKTIREFTIETMVEKTKAIYLK